MSEAAEHQASADDVEVVRRLNSLFEQLDVGSLRDVVEDTRSLHELRGGPFEWVAELIWELVDEEVEVMHRGRGRGSGPDVELPQTQLWQVRDGRAIRCRIYASRAGAEAALSGP